MHSKPMILRLGIPKTSGTFPIVARKIGAAVMVSAGALWVPSAEQFRLPSGRCALLDMALDSSGFVRHAYQGGYPWSVAQYVELAWQVGWAWWSQMDLPCEQQIAPNRAEVISRIGRSAELYAECLAETRRVRSASGQTSLAAHLSDPVPVLQGRLPEDYDRSTGLIAEARGGELPSFVGVGSLCTRHVNGPDGLLAVLAHLDAILPAETRLHLYGVKGDAIAEIVKYKRVASLDSMGWDFGARAAANKRFVKMTAEEQEQVQLRKLRNTTAHREQHMRAWYARQCQIIKENSDVRV